MTLEFFHFFTFLFFLLFEIRLKENISFLLAIMLTHLVLFVPVL